MEIQPCPWCGNVPDEEDCDIDTAFDLWSVWCPKCQACGPSIPDEEPYHMLSQERAIEAWNNIPMRAELAALRERAEKAEAHLKRMRDDINTTEAALGISGIYAKLENDRDEAYRISGDRWKKYDAERQDHEITKRERDGLRRLLQEARGCMALISQKGHHTGYDWNADPEGLTLLEGKIDSEIAALLAKM